MADRAHSWTDWKIEELEKELDKIYARAEKELEDRAQKYFDRFSKLDEQKRALLDAGKLTEEEYNRWKTGKIMTGKHWTEMKEQTAQDLLKVNQTAASYINDQLPAVYTRNYNQVAAGINGQIRGYSFDLVDSATVRRLATDDKTLLPYKYIDGVKDVRWNTGKVNSEILQGILQGDSIPHLAKRLSNVTEMNRTSAIRNARTACTSAENKGRMDMMEDAEEKGVHVQKKWIATNDSRTRESHMLLDGATIDQDEEFDNGLMYPGDPNGEPEEVYNCRCTLGYKVVSFAQLKVTAPQQEVAAVTADGTMVEFEKAKNVAEAEEYAQQFMGYNGKVSYKGIDVEYANACNKALTEVNEKYDIPGLQSIQPMNMRQNLWKNSTSEAAYRWGSGDLFINPKYYKSTKTLNEHIDEINSLMDTVLKNGQALIDNGRVSGSQLNYVEALLKTGRQCVSQSYDFAEGTFIHECGHMLDDRLFRSELRTTFGNDVFVKDRLHDSMIQYGSNISGYAVSNNREYIAESFSAWWYGEGEKCDPKIVEIFERTAKK